MLCNIVHRKLSDRVKKSILKISLAKNEHLGKFEKLANDLLIDKTSSFAIEVYEKRNKKNYKLRNS